MEHVFGHRRKLCAITAAVAGVISSLGVPGQALAGVVHQYSFNTDGEATDPVGGADGTIINGATVSGGQLTSVGGGSGAAGTAPGVSLPGGAVDGLSGDFSIETFFTRGGTSQNFPTLFNFGAGATDTNNYVIATPSRATSNVPGVAFKQAGVNGGAEVVLTGGFVDLNASAYIATTFSSGTATMYLNGAPVSQSSLLSGFDLSTKGVKSGIQSQAPFGDPGMVGSTTEFRISDDAISGRTIALNFLAGPDNAVTVNTNNSIGTGDFNGGAFASTPTAAQVVVIGSGHTVTLASGAGVGSLVEVAGGGTLTVAGGTLTPTTSLNVAANGTVNVNTGGTLAVRGILADGQATGTANGTRVLNLNGGTLQAAATFVASAGLTTNLLAASTIDTNNATGNGVLMNGPIAGTGGLNKAGGGTLTLTGSMTSFSGAVNINVGTLTIAPPAARVTGGTPFANPISFSSAAAGALVINQASAIDLTGTMTLPAPSAATVYNVSTVGTGNNANFAGVIAGGNANSTLNLTGFFRFGNAGNTYSGRTQFNTNTSIQIDVPQAFGNSTLVFNNGGFQNAADLVIANPYTFGATAAAFFNAAGSPNAGRTTTMSGSGTLVGTGNNTFAVAQPTVTLSGVVSGGGIINKTGTGTLVLSGDNTFTGNLVFPTGAANSGAIRLAHNNAAGTGAKTISLPGDNAAIQTVELIGNITVNNVTLNTSGRNASNVSLRNVSGNNTLGGGGYNITGTGGGYAIESVAGKLTITGGVSNTITNARTLNLIGAGAGEISSLIRDTSSSTGALTIAKSGGAGTWTISSASTYSGGTSISVGELAIAGAGGRLGSGNVSVIAGTDSRLRIASGVLDGISNTATLSLAGGGTVGTADQGYAFLETGVNEIVGSLVLGGVTQSSFGTYGSTTSGALFQNDEFFSGNGVVSLVPEPASLSLATLGLVGLLARRRRRAV